MYCSIKPSLHGIYVREHRGLSNKAQFLPWGTMRVTQGSAQNSVAYSCSSSCSKDLTYRHRRSSPTAYIRRNWSIAGLDPPSLSRNRSSWVVSYRCLDIESRSNIEEPPGSIINECPSLRHSVLGPKVWEDHELEFESMAAAAYGTFGILEILIKCGAGLALSTF
jgi:hypothetical protein